MPIMRSNLLDLDIDKLFQEHSVDDVIEIEKLLTVEIEKKHNALRSMVGDRYKDVLMASDAIKSMKTISQDIVNYIDNIMDTCEHFNICPVPVGLEKTSISQKQKNERSIIAQMRLAIFMNEQIWIALDEENNLEATQYYLLGQHVHTGLSLYKEEYLRTIPLLQQVKANLVTLRSQIFERINTKLERVDITSQEISNNLNALILLDNQSCNNLLDIYIKHRKVALKTVIDSPYPNVRVHICSMVETLITTICLLHDCFISYQQGSNRGLIWQLLEEIISENSQVTMSKLNLPITPLNSYIPEIIKQFRPKFTNSNGPEIVLKDAEQLVKNWLASTRKLISNGLDESLQLITNIKGLHFTREESLKIELPGNWKDICVESFLPKNFTVWSYFFQDIVTTRCKALITARVLDKFEMLKECIKDTLDKAVGSEKSETNLRWLMWTEEATDINKFENTHKGLSMKTKGFSKRIVDLCETMDSNYLQLLEDVSQYLYGEEFKADIDINSSRDNLEKFVDRIDIENHLRAECIDMSIRITDFAKQVSVYKNAVTKSIICARFLEGVLQLCPHFEKCCTLNNSMENWSKISDTFNKTIHVLWQIWIGDIVQNTEIECKKLSNISSSSMIKLMTRWDEIEILEQTEERVFKSQIKVPLKPSIALNNVLEKLNNNLSCILPHTLSKTVHLQFIEQNVTVILNQYLALVSENLNQKQALQFLFDMKFLTIFIIPRENVKLINCSQEICDNLRSKIDPFDLDVFYSYLQANVKKAVAQSQVIFGGLLPSAVHLATLGIAEKAKEHENHSILALAVTSSAYWFPLLPISVPSLKMSVQSTSKKNAKDNSQKLEARVESSLKKSDSTNAMKHSASSIFGGLASDWFS